MAAASLKSADAPQMLSTNPTCPTRRKRKYKFTSYWYSYHRHRGPPIYLLLVALALSSIRCAAEWQLNGGVQNTPRDYNSLGEWSVQGPIQNVSCISHDTKFTCDCQHVNQRLQLPHLMGYVFQVEVSNCKSLTIDANALEGTQGLRKITFRNIENLALNKYALAFPRHASNTPLIVEFDRVNFELIDSHAINGNIEEISFVGGRIDVIHPFGFTTLKDRAVLLKMDSMLVKRIEPQAFKKFAVEQMEITNSIFESGVPSKAFYELDVLNTLRLYGNNFQEVHSHAFSFKMINKLSITGNFFMSADSEWIEAYVRESISIRDNYFGLISPIAFKGINIHRDYMHSERLELRFINNTVRFPLESRPLDFNERFALSLKQLQYENTFACKEVDTSQKPPQPKQAFFRNNVDNIYFRRTADKAVANSPGASTNHQSFVVLSKLLESDCQQRSYWLYILLGISALLLLLIVIAVIVWMQWSKRRKRRKMDVVMPEPRTYKETQIVYQIENAGLLKTDL